MAEPAVQRTPSSPPESAPPPASAIRPTGAEGAPRAPAAVDPELEWLANVYQGDVPQLTPRAVAVGAVLGAVMALSNLYVGLKTGWSVGVSVTACILSYALYGGLARVAPRVFGQNLTLLENNAMQSTASAAGYSTCAILVSAVPALLMVQGHHLPWPVLLAWVFFVAVLGTVIAVPMKRQMVNLERLPFPTGMASAETLRSLYGRGRAAIARARALFAAMGVGAIVGALRDALGILPGLLPIPGLAIRGVAAARYTLAFEGSFILAAAGAIMGIRTTASMCAAALFNYGVLAPWAKEQGAITEIGYRPIVSWSLWIGASVMVTSGLLQFALQWRTVARAFRDLPALVGRKPAGADPLAAIEVPTSWFLAGASFGALGLIVVGAVAFGIHPLLGAVAVLMAFVLAIVACRATGETDVTPIAALGKVTQLAYGVLVPQNVAVNLTTASITAGAAASSADLLTDLKSGYLLGANPRRQFLAQLAGTVVGALVVVPAFYKLVPTPDAVGNDKFPAPAAQVWRGVAQVLAKGVESLHPTARWGMAIGAAVGIVLPLLELALPRHKKFLPSAMGIGLAFVVPGFNSISFFLGAVAAWVFARSRPTQAASYTIPVASGLIAGESLLGVAVALLTAAGLMR